jgi:hemolysin type calcium-binding protein
MPMSARLAGLLAATVLLLTPAVALAQDEETDRCEPRKQGEQCGEGNGRKTAGGGNTGNVSHKGWPAITGILWKVLDSGDHERTGTEDNDELLGHHGDDTVVGLEGKDVLWGDWELKGNGSNQSDTLRGGDGNDFLYPSHGKNNMYGGAGNDRIIAYYGHGLIDCGPGTGDYAQTRWQSSAYKVRNCEHIRHFCAFGSKPNGDCKKPGENALAVLSRQASHAALLSFLDAW